MLNVVTYALVENEVDDVKRQRLYDELHGPFRTMDVVKDEPVAAADQPPAWWHGDEDAYESAMVATATLGRRRRRR